MAAAAAHTVDDSETCRVLQEEEWEVLQVRHTSLHLRTSLITDTFRPSLYTQTTSLEDLQTVP